MAAYIKGAAVISPQKTFSEQGFPDEVVLHSAVDRLKCIEPAYRDFIDPMISRRMSRIVKMGVCSALKCMQLTGIHMPDAIIAGTGLGCLEDTEKFLSSIYTNEEKLLNPTPFIQSTHNTVAGAIALAIKCHGYNTTYTHRGFSFESALQDALMQLAEDDNLNILAGGFDELTETSYNLTKRLGLWKNHITDTGKLSDYNTRGSIPGEGVAFFMLAGKPGTGDMARLKSINVFFQPQDFNAINDHILNFLDEQGENPASIDLVMLGVNGDTRTDTIYYRVMEELFRKTSCISYKQLCGEYDTSSSFAMFMASLILKQQQIPDILRKDSIPESINNILIYNHLRGENHSLYLLEKC